MDSTMIAAGPSVLMLCAAFGLAYASPAHADVMEVGYGAHRWVTGPAGVSEDARAQPPASTEGASAYSEIDVPGEAVAITPAAAEMVPGAYSSKVHELSSRYDLSPSLIEALVWQESRWRANAVSPAGARGLMQLMPGTARYLGVDPDDPYSNLEGGARYLREQLNRFDGNIEKALAAYNAGPGRVAAAGGIPRIRETQNYVAAIMGRLSAQPRK